jgi:hypothetical protein
MCVIFYLWPQTKVSDTTDTGFLAGANESRWGVMRYATVPFASRRRRIAAELRRQFPGVRGQTLNLNLGGNDLIDDRRELNIRQRRRFFGDYRANFHLLVHRQQIGFRCSGRGGGLKAFPNSRKDHR